MPVDGPRSVGDASPMPGPPPSALDVLHGASAAGALLAGDREAALDALARASTRYVAGFVCRLALIAPGVSLRLALGVVRRRVVRDRR